MKKLFFLCVLIVVGCADENSLEKEISAIPIDVNITRFDQVFLSATPSDLPKLKEVYPLFFPSSIPDSTWVYTMRDPLQKELKQEIDITFADFSTVQRDIKSLLQHLEFYFPEYNPPKIVTVTTEDYRKKIILYQDMILIALNTYLGANHRYYEGIQNYIVQNFEKEMIPVDIATEFAYAQIRPSRDRSFLSKMIFHGKAHYIKTLLVPKASAAMQFGYTERQVNWAAENEAQIWTHFIEKELLYSTDNKLDARFLNLAPFSKFYLELDSESPGGIGRYIGYRIVDAYMKNNDVSLQELIGKSTEEIFNNSKYKPKK
ncbi:gliding motility lipoprotein GldB [Kordia sp. YSTF-M3]|uniref:Gliding motility lipoprotein GldB n=1 Tax=Kordia aestuariivivens TaxID=2759037 RepID=A0ABR7Q436_9FLAO|nr:gliding motility lipoprotein GldB [Kordia aestuariivivens]MBC8753316.1 gliding motility lipoprotein GldB [Kordia aestuariivivens]